MRNNLRLSLIGLIAGFVVIGIFNAFPSAFFENRPWEGTIAPWTLPVGFALSPWLVSFLGWVAAPKKQQTRQAVRPEFIPR